MNVFEKTREIAKTFFNDWIQICDPKSHWTIEDFSGGNNKKFQIYKLKSSYMIFPNGKIKNNTLIGGDQ